MAQFATGGAEIAGLSGLGVAVGRRVGAGVGIGVPARSVGICCCTVCSDMANPTPSTSVSEILKVLMPRISPEVESMGRRCCRVDGGVGLNHVAEVGRAVAHRRHDPPVMVASPGSPNG